MTLQVPEVAPPQTFQPVQRFPPTQRLKPSGGCWGQERSPQNPRLVLLADPAEATLVFALTETLSWKRAPWRSFYLARDADRFFAEG